MNRIYSLVWNRALHVLQVASELASSHGGSSIGTHARRPGHRRPLILACAAALAFGSSALPAWAATYTVTKATDNGTGTVQGTLSWAIKQANADPGSTIVFNLPSGSTLTETGTLPAITQPVAFSGTTELDLIDKLRVTGAGTLTVNGQSVHAGQGSAGVNNGDGGNGIYAGAGTRIDIMQGSNTEVFGGYSVGGGSGGTAIVGVDSRIQNSAQIYGGAGAGANPGGGAGTIAPGAGGVGVSISGSSGVFTNARNVTGGPGGYGLTSSTGHGGDGATGGAAISALGGAQVRSTGVIQGGKGGAGGYSAVAVGGKGGAGGAAVAGVDFQFLATPPSNTGFNTTAGGYGGTGGMGGYGSTGASGTGDHPDGGDGSAGATGGKGGDGGAGVSGSGFTVTNQNDEIRGGRGGYGGYGGQGGAGGAGVGYGDGGDGGPGGAGGNGGQGGAGIAGTGFTLANYGTIVGGYGGRGGYGGSGGDGGIFGAGGIGSPPGNLGKSGATGMRGTAGAGGVGVLAQGDDTIINGGSIAGGLSGDGLQQADAVDLSNGGNTLTLLPGFSFTGNVVSTSGTAHGGDTLVLGMASEGGGTGNGSLDLSALVDQPPTSYTGSTQYYGFSYITKTGINVWTLSGSTAVTAPWEVEAGTLVVGDASHTTTSIAGNATVDNGAVLAGYGTVGGSVDVHSGGVLVPGAVGSVGTLHVTGNLTLESGSILDADLGAPSDDVAIPGASDLVAVGGDLLLQGGTVNPDDVGNMGPGLYQIITYDGTCTGCSAGGLVVGAAPGSGQQFTLQYISGAVNLLDGPVGTTLSIWAPNGVANLGGTGVWSSTSTNWTDINNSTPAAMAPQPGIAIFENTGGKVTVDDSNGPVGATKMQFAASGYTLTGDAVQLAGTINGTTIDPAIIQVGNGTAAGASITATIDSVLTGSAGLTKTDYGKLVLAGANTFTGPITVNGGTLEVATGSAIPVSAVVVDNSAGHNATLQMDAGTSLNIVSSSLSSLYFGLALTHGGNLDNAGAIESDSRVTVVAVSPSSIVNHDGGTITGTGVAVQLSDGGSLTNDGAGSAITGNLFSGSDQTAGIGVEVMGGGTVTNIHGATITGATDSVVMLDAGTITNGAGSTIAVTGSTTGNCAQQEGAADCAIVVVPTQGQTNPLTLTNAGTIIGNAQLDPAAANIVTLTAGGVIQGDLDIGTNTASTLTLNGDTGTSETYANAVTGTTTFKGTLIKSGAGIWTLDDNTMASIIGTTVQGGTLVVGDASHNSATVAGNAEVDSGSTLAGFGHVGGSVEVKTGGVLAPGSSTTLGTLHVGGNLMLEQGSALDVAFGKPGANTRPRATATTSTSAAT